MLDVINITAPIFLLILAGYLGVRFAILPKEALPGMSRFVLYYALPALIFSKLINMQVSDVIKPQFLLVYGLGGLLTMALTILASRLIFKDKWQLAGIRGMGAAMPNSVFIGFPILLQLFEHPPVAAFSMALLVENLLLMPLALLFIEGTSVQSSTRQTAMGKTLLKRCLRNPIIIAVFAAMFGMAVELQLPMVIARSLDMLTAGAAAVALVIIGGSLVGCSVRDNLGQIALVSLSKLLMFPLVVSALLLLTPELSHEHKLALLIFSAMPMFSIYPIIGNEYGEGRFCASSLLLTTIVSFISISLLLHIIV